MGEWRATIGEITGLRRFRKWHDGKQSFKSAEAADASIRALKRRGERESGQALRDGESLRPYECREDGSKHWHVGHYREPQDRKTRQ